MNKRCSQSRLLVLSLLGLALGLALGLGLLMTTSGRAGLSPMAPSPGNEECQVCHANPSLKMTLPSGEGLPLFVDSAAFGLSVHGDEQQCSDCHRQIKGYPHPKLEVTARRDYKLVQYESCRGCHFEIGTKAEDSIHYAMLVQGNKAAAVCGDCHGAHYVGPPYSPRPRISQTCAQCHQKVYETYAASIHGQALVEEKNQDVPVCTDCHGVHNIHDPRTANFRLYTPELCAQCHSDEQRMQKYGLSSQVLKTYLQDFHGVTVNLYKKQSPDIWSYKAVCTDCHGVHNIASGHGPQSLALKENVVQVCRRCHPEAGTNFPEAWLSHYDPSPTKSPLVFYVRMFYWGFVPFIVGGLTLHILLDLGQLGRKRRAGRKEEEEPPHDQ